MSAGKWSHYHADTLPGRRVIHSPEGGVNGYVQRLRVRGQSRPGYQPQDEHGSPLTTYADTFDEAWTTVNER